MAGRAPCESQGSASVRRLLPAAGWFATTRWTLANAETRPTSRLLSAATEGPRRGVPAPRDGFEAAAPGRDDPLAWYAAA
jgi:hypothetical protein